MAQSNASTDPQSARSKGTSSIVLSVIGLSVGIIGLIIFIVLYAVGIITLAVQAEVSGSLT